MLTFNTLYVYFIRPTLGQGLTLFCKVVNCTVNGTKRWRGGPDDKVLMLNSGISTNKAKYSTSIEKNGSKIRFARKMLSHRFNHCVIIVLQIV
jgi:hypothetical protein